jgi:hypothetical protein
LEITLGPEVNQRYKNQTLKYMAWIIIIVGLMIASVASAYLIPNESINTKNLPDNRP